jgi:hypothetical protein
MEEWNLLFPGGQKYQSVSQDTDSSQRANLLKGKPWSFLNLLPIPVTLYVTYPVELDLIDTIPANGKLTATRTKSGRAIDGNMDLHVTYKTGDVEYEILRPVTLFYDSRSVRIGDVVQDSRDTTTTIRTHCDISGIRVHNHIGIPLNISFLGNIVASVEKDNGTSFMMGSPNSVFLNNDGRGFRFGDVLSFSFRDGTKYCDVQIIDNYMSDIYVGTIQQKFVEQLRDYYSYNPYLDINALKYFDRNVTAYYGY